MEKTTMKMTILSSFFGRNQCCVKIECKRAKHFETIHRWTQQINFDTNKIYSKSYEMAKWDSREKSAKYFHFFRSNGAPPFVGCHFYLCAIVIYPKGEKFVEFACFSFRTSFVSYFSLNRKRERKKISFDYITFHINFSVALDGTMVKWSGDKEPARTHKQKSDARKKNKNN